MRGRDLVPGEGENFGGLGVGEHAEEILEFAVKRATALVFSGKPMTFHKDLAEAFQCGGFTPANRAAGLSLRNCGEGSLQVGLFSVRMGKWLELQYELMRARAASGLLRTRWGQGLPTAFRGHFWDVNRV